MPLIAKEHADQQFEPCPPGLHRAVCVDVVDLGLQETPYGAKHKVKLIWQVPLKNKQGERYQIRATYTLSLAEGSNLRRDLESWRGRAFTEEERKGFDLEKLLGVNCQLNVMHGQSAKGRTYAKATAVLPLDKAAAKLAPENYTREPWADSKPPEPADDFDPVDDGSAAQYDDDSVPFAAFLAPLAGILLSGMGLFA